MFLQYFDTVGLVFWPVKTVARITYTVLDETLNPAQSINQSLIRQHAELIVNQSWIISYRGWLQICYNLLYSGICLNMEILGNSVQHQRIIVTNKMFYNSWNSWKTVLLVLGTSSEQSHALLHGQSPAWVTYWLVFMCNDHCCNNLQKRNYGSRKLYSQATLLHSCYKIHF